MNHQPRHRASSWLVCAILFLGIIANVASGAETRNPNAIVQFSTIKTLSDGKFAGQWRCAEILKYGDFGTGTLDGLDGETIILDGKIFQATSAGTVLHVSKEARVPFTTITRFHADQAAELSDIGDFSQLEKALDQLLPDPGLSYAVRVEGIFSAVKVRSCPKQNKPFRPLLEVTKEQSVFNLQNIPGTLVGFRLPTYIQGLNLNGYHFHFIAKDHTSGGHVLDCQFNKAAAQIQTSQELRLFFYKENAPHVEDGKQKNVSMKRIRP